MRQETARGPTGQAENSLAVYMPDGILSGDSSILWWMGKKTDAGRVGQPGVRASRGRKAPEGLALEGCGVLAAACSLAPSCGTGSRERRPQHEA